MKTPEDVLRDVGDRLRKTWSQVVVGADWRPEFRLGTSGLSGGRLADSWSDIHPGIMRWREWAAALAGVELVCRPATVHRTQQSLPATLVVATIDAAAGLVGEEWVSRLLRARERLAELEASFPTLGDPAGMLRVTDSYSDVDFDLLCRTALWFAGPHPAGLTARQIPVEGLGTKWLGQRESAVRRLAAVDDLGLVRGRPQCVHLTYLDPAYLAAGGRRHDLATLGDADAVAYRPRVVLISENRDTAQLFPHVEGVIAIEGDGRGAGAIAALSWVHKADCLIYWGDMDADGLEILQGFRAAGLSVRSLYMDLASYERWERFGVDHDHAGKALGPRVPRETSLLEHGERELYLALCSPEWTRHRRIEQERIPLGDAAAVVRLNSEGSTQPRP